MLQRVHGRFFAPIPAAFQQGDRRTRLLFLAPCAFIALAISVKLIDRVFYWGLVVEDGWFEVATALLYLISTGAALGLGLAFLRAGERRAGQLQLLIAAGFLFICLEEISWGQRIFQLPTPAFFETYNRQQEISIHNFARRPILHLVYILVGLYGATAWFLAPPRLLRRLGGLAPLLIPPWQTTLYFLPAVLLYGYYDYVSAPLTFFWGPAFDFDRGMGERYFIMARDQEVVEILIAVGFLLHQLYNWRRWREQPAAAEVPPLAPAR